MGYGIARERHHNDRLEGDHRLEGHHRLEDHHWLERHHRRGWGAVYARRFRGNARNAGCAPPGPWLVREAAPEWAADAPDSAGAGAEADRLLELADEIVTLSAHIQAATARLLELVAEFDRLGGWRAEGHRTCGHWLAHHTGLDLGAAREKVRSRGRWKRCPRRGR